MTPGASRLQLPLPLLVVYDDSLHSRWKAQSHQLDGPSANPNTSLEHIEQNGGQVVPCSRSIKVSFYADHVHGSSAFLVLSSDEVITLPDATKLVLLLLWQSSGLEMSEQSKCGPEKFSRGTCSFPFCVGLRLHLTPTKDTLFAPVCKSTKVGEARMLNNSFWKKRRKWSQLQLKVDDFGLNGSFDEILFIQGRNIQPLKAPSVLLLDDIQLAVQRLPRMGESLPSYGGNDLTPIRVDWTKGVSRRGAVSSALAKKNPNLCKYMSSELAHVREGERRPLCKVDGDHLRGRWMQTCDPRRIRRADHFAYGRALPSTKGWYDYRLCFRQSASERLRSLQALSWSWRPYDCALAPVCGSAFTSWLGGRTILFLGDSLTAQSYYSLVFLLGGAVIEQSDLYGRVPGESTPMHEVRMGACESSVGNEGGHVSIATLRGGGRLIKVMRHVELVYELQQVRSAFWFQWLREADFVAFNVGHHYHTYDPRFENYVRFARIVLKQLAKLSKPSAQLIYRTTNIGHNACENATRPHRSRQAAWQELSTGALFEWRPPQNLTGRSIDLFADKYSWRGPPLHEPAWERLAKRNALLKRFVLLNVSFVDARADGHVAKSMRYSAVTGEFGARWKATFPLDCLHYCYPGPADFWALALYNLLLNNPQFRKQSATNMSYNQ